MLPWKRLLRPLAALLLTATVAVVPAATAAQAADAPSHGWNDYSCKPSAAHPRPVVLVHGTFANSVDNWLALAPYLENRDYCVFSFDYGQLPGVPLVHGLGPIDKSAEQLKTFVDKVLAATGAAETDLVGHSQGGMMPRYYLKFLGGADKVNALVGIAPDNHGTTLSGLTNLLPYFPGVGEFLTTNTPALADQVVGSAFLTKLNAGGRHRPRRQVHGPRQQVRRGRDAVPEPVPERGRRPQRAAPGPVSARPLRARGHRSVRPDRLPRGRQRPRPGPRHRHHLRLGPELSAAGACPA
ncbi:pimeloyl-ACP methyl ester carboxylesterase [Streptomyces canus]